MTPIPGGELHGSMVMVSSVYTSYAREVCLLSLEGRDTVLASRYVLKSTCGNNVENPATPP